MSLQGPARGCSYFNIIIRACSYKAPPVFLPTRYGHGNTKTNCDFCGADGADGCRHQSSTCPHDQDLSMEQSRVLIMDKKDELSGLQDARQ